MSLVPYVRETIREAYLHSTRPVLDHPYPPVGVDFETYYDDECSIRTLGAYAYTHHPRFVAYLVAINDGENRYVGPPEDFAWESLSGRLLVSHNASFDSSVYATLLEHGIVDRMVPAEWNCTANLSCFLKSGRSLKNAAKNLLGMEVSKDVRKLMKGLMPEEMKQLVRVEGKGKSKASKLISLEDYCASAPEFGVKTFYDEVVAYAEHDTELCRLIWLEWGHMFPEFERRLSLMTTRQSQKGFQVDIPGLLGDIQVLEHAREEAKAGLPWAWTMELDPEMAEKSPEYQGHWVLSEDDEGILSIPKLQDAIKEMGYEPPRTTSEDAIETQEWEKNHPDCKYIEHMRTFRKTGILLQRCRVLVDRADPEGRFQYGMRYYGAIKTGRWAGGSNERQGGTGEKGFNVHNFPKKPLCGVDLRKRVVAPKGKKLIIADAAQIEPRCTAWICGDEAKLQMIRKGVSVYQVHAVQTMNWPAELNLKKEDPEKYQLSKIRVLGLGYGCGHVKFRDFAASQYDYFMTLAESKKQVRDFRQKEHLITKMWNKLSYDFQQAYADGTWEMELPSGRTLDYIDIHPHGNEWLARREYGGKFSKYYGGLLFENLIQATARDVFGVMQINIEDEFGDVQLFHVHDELVAEVDLGVSLKEFEEVMSQPSREWLHGLPIGVEAKESDYYLK